MCKNATKTAAELMSAIEPTLKSLLTYTNLIDTPEGQAAINAYDEATAALQNWKSGTPADEVLALITDFQTVFDGLPIPDSEKALANIILAGVETVIGVIIANSPAPAAPAGVEVTASEEETAAMHQHAVIAETSSRVEELVPGFKRSIWHSAASQYNKAWNDAAEARGLETLKV